MGPIGVEVGRHPRAQMMDVAVVLEPQDPVQDVEPLLAGVPGRGRRRAVGMDGDAQGLEGRRPGVAAARGDGQTSWPGRRDADRWTGRRTGRWAARPAGCSPACPARRPGPGGRRSTADVRPTPAGTGGPWTIRTIRPSGRGSGRPRRAPPAGALVERAAAGSGHLRHTTALLSLRQQKLSAFTMPKHCPRPYVLAATVSRSGTVTSSANRVRTRLRWGSRTARAASLSAAIDSGTTPTALGLDPEGFEESGPPPRVPPRGGTAGPGVGSDARGLVAVTGAGGEDGGAPRWIEGVAPSASAGR